MLEFIFEHWFIEAVVLMSAAFLIVVIVSWFADQFNKDQ